MSDEPKLELDAIEARANAVAECSWEPRDDWNWARAVTNTAQKLRRDLNISTSARLPFVATFDKTSDAQFFVQARADILALVKRIRELENLNRILATDAESAETERAPHLFRHGVGR